MVIASYNLRNLFDAGVPVGASGREVVLTQDFVDACAANIRKVVDAITPDILMAQEVGSERVLRAIAEMREPKYEVSVAAPDKRGIANGVIFRGDVSVTSLPDFAEGFPTFIKGEEDVFGKHLEPIRPFVYAKAIYRNKPLHVIGVHLKTSWPLAQQSVSKEKLSFNSQSEAGDGVIRATILKLAQAKAIRACADDFFRADSEAQIIITGDFNATEHAEALRIICGELYTMPATQLENLCERVPDMSRYSYLGRGKKRLLDHMLVSCSLLPHVRDIRVLNDTILDQFGKPDDTFTESDHAPVVLLLE